MSGHERQIAAVVLAGGSGTRLGLGDSQNKVYVEVGGRPLLAWSIQTLDAHPEVVSIVIVVRSGDEPALAATLEAVQPVTALQVAQGGPTRSASERAGFRALRRSVDAGAIDLIMVHDGARPFIAWDLLERTIDAADIHGAAIPALAPQSPVFELDASSRVAVRLDATALRRVQTPQGFSARRLLDAYDRAEAAGFEGVDTAEVVAHFGNLHARTVAGDLDNIKVTTPPDVGRARSIAASWPRR